MRCAVRRLMRSSCHTCNQWGDPFAAGGLDPHLISDVQKNLGITHRPQGKFAEIRVGGKIFQGM